MTPAAPDLREALFDAEDWVADLVAGLDTGRLGDPTPCPGYDVRGLLTHILAVQAKVVGFATDHRDVLRDPDASPEAFAQQAEAYAVEHVDGRSAAELAHAVRARTAQAREVWGEETLDIPMQLGWGPVLPGRIVTGIYLFEILTHGWDLATATGQPSEAPGGLGELGLGAAMASLPDEMPRGIELGVPFGPKVTPAPDAGPTERMVNWTGRPSR